MAIGLTERVIALVDMDCFYVQVEQRRDPSIRGKPCAVVQYNEWKGGGIIAVSYEARAEGVTRNMRGDEAKEKCPEIKLCKVPIAHGKADLTRYRDACAEVIQVLLQFGARVERASVDEAFIDLTEVIDVKLKKCESSSECLPKLSDLKNTHAVGYPQQNSENEDKEKQRYSGLSEYVELAATDNDNLRLAMGAELVEEIRLAVYEQTMFRCSAGIAHNKVLAKLACGINKPNKQTILPMGSVDGLFKKIKIGKIRNLGGKLGKTLNSNFGIDFIGQLTDLPKTTLISTYGGKTGQWLYEICRGIDHELVKERHFAQSVGCSKTFPGGNALNTRTKLKKWINCLAVELVERLFKDRDLYNRVAKGLTAYVGLQGRKSVSRACPIDQYEVELISKNILSTLEQLNQCNDTKSDVWYPAITVIGISAQKFKDYSGPQKKTYSSMKMSSLDLYMTSPSKKSSLPSSSEGTVGHFANAEKHDDTLTTKSEAVGDSLKNQNNCNLSPMDKKRSFISQMISIQEKNKTPLCKIEKVYMNDRRLEEKLKSKTAPSGDDESVEPRIPPATCNHTKMSNELEPKDCKRRYSLDDDVTSTTSLPAKEIATNSHFVTCNMKDNKHASSKVDLTSVASKKPFFSKLKEIRSNNDENTMSTSEKTKVIPEETNDQIFNPTKHKKSLSIQKCDRVCSTTMQHKQPKPNAVTTHSYNMNEIDMEVFNTLPIYLQDEIRSSSQQSISRPGLDLDMPMNKRRKVTPPGGQKTMAGFLSRVDSPFETSGSGLSGKQTTNKSFVKRRQSDKKSSTRSGKVVFQSDFADGQRTPVPLGFFRARSQASAAIRNAVEKHAQTSLKNLKKKSEVINLENENMMHCLKDVPTTSTQKSCSPFTEDNSCHNDEHTLWSSLVNNGATYQCDECNEQIPISQLPQHNDYHVVQDLLHK